MDSFFVERDKIGPHNEIDLTGLPRSKTTVFVRCSQSFHRGTKDKGARAGRMRTPPQIPCCEFSLVVRGEGDVNYSPLVVHYSNHHRLLPVRLMPGCNFVVTGRQL